MADAALKIVEEEPEAEYIPEGYDSVSEFLAEVREQYQQDVDADRLNRDAGLEDLKFLSGEQWDEDALLARKGLPCLTINRLPQFVLQVVGDIRINRPGIKVRPGEDTDKDKAEVREGLIRQIERECRAHDVYANAGQNQVSCGIGNFRVALDYASNDVFDRVIRIKPIPNAFAVVWDAMSIDPTGKDANHCFVVEEMSRKVFEDRYPGKTANELGDTVERQGWLTKDTVRVTEYWTVKHRPAEIALLADGRIVDLTEENRAQFTPLIARNGSGQPMVRQTMRKSVCMYLITGHAILEPAVEYRLSRLPIIKVTGFELNVGEERRRWGLVRFAKDAQRLLNYWRSVSAQLIALAPKSKWLVHNSAEGQDDDFSTDHNDGKNVLHWNGSTAPQHIPPPDIPAAVLNEARLAAQDLKDVTGLHDASMGAQSNETSGKAIRARQMEGDVAAYIYHDNLRSSIGEAGVVVNEFIPQVYDTARTITVLGPDEVVQSLRINDPNDPEAISFGNERYDIAVETGPAYSTKRVEAAESMVEHGRTNPMLMQVAGDLVAQSQDWPMADKIAERLRKAMPPHIVAGEEGAPEPPPPSPQQMEAMGMAKAKAEAETTEAIAKAKKAGAEARKAEVEAAQAEQQMAASGFQAAVERAADQIQAIAGPEVAAQFVSSLLPPAAQGLQPPQPIPVAA